MLEAKLADYFVDLTTSSSPPWTTLGPMDDKTLQKSAKQKIIEIAANPINSEERDSAVKGIDKRINKDGSISYRARVRVKGHPPVIKTFDCLTKAKKWKRNTEVEIEDGRYFSRLEAQKHTLGEAIDRYIKHIVPKKPKNAKNVRQHLLWWKEQIGAYTLDCVKPGLIAEKRDSLLAQPTYRNKPRSPTTVVRYLSSLSHLFTIAIDEWEWLRANPVQKVKKPKVNPGRTRFLSNDERVHLLEACKASESKNLYLIVLLVLSCGMRYSEVMSLSKDNIDLENSVIILKDTKNGEIRSMPLVGLPLVLLRAHLLLARTHLLFPSTINADKPLDIRSAFQTALKKAAITNFTFHDLRHTTGSYLAMGGHSLLDISTLLGHKSLQMTKRYAHLSQEYKKKLVTTMAEKMFENTDEFKKGT